MLHKMISYKFITSLYRDQQTFSLKESTHPMSAYVLKLKIQFKFKFMKSLKSSRSQHSGTYTVRQDLQANLSF